MENHRTFIDTIETPHLVCPEHFTSEASKKVKHYFKKRIRKLKKNILNFIIRPKFIYMVLNKLIQKESFRKNFLLMLLKVLD